jgi:NAD(P)-dependent dehydrogenase (short-subunit alcohol dehydrogenase family)
LIVLARDEELGLKAVKQLQQSNRDARNKVKFHQLDITDVESIHQLADYIKKTHGGLDILINNAGIAFKVMTKIIIKFNHEKFISRCMM